MIEYIMSTPGLGGLIIGALLWGTLYTVLGFVFKDKIARNVGFWTLFLGVVLLVIA